MLMNRGKRLWGRPCETDGPNERILGKISGVNVAQHEEAAYEEKKGGESRAQLRQLKRAGGPS